MYWQYRTILFEFHKDGLLGDKYVDDEEVEKVLNEQGEQGWELVGVSTVQEGLLTFFKKIRPQTVAPQAGRTGQSVAARSEASARTAVAPPARAEEGQPPGGPSQVGEQVLPGPKKKGGTVGEIKIS